MKEEYKDFVGIYDESVPLDLCNDFVENYEKAKKNRKTSANPFMYAKQFIQLGYKVWE